MIKEGKLAPDFILPTSDGKNISLSDFRGKKVVLYFYPKDMTPGCTTEACDFRDAHTEFLHLNAVILGVSRDLVSKHEKFVNKYELPFLLLSDEKGEVCQQYGVLKEKTMFGKTYLGIERSTFIIDDQGILIKAYRKVKVKEHVKEALQFIQEMSR